MTRRRSIFALCAIAALGCASIPAAKPAPPPVRPAPGELAELTVHVHKLVQPPETPEDQWEYKNMPGITGDLRTAVELRLVQAGYRIALTRDDESDLVATIHATWPMDSAGVATMKLTARGEVIDRFSVVIPAFGEPPVVDHLEDHAAVGLVDAMSRSPALIELARKLRAKRGLQVAVPEP